MPQLTLFGETWPPGVWVGRNFLSEETQKAWVKAIREMARAAPFYAPVMRDGRPFNLRITSAGALGWHSDQQGYRYVPHHPQTGRSWPAIPDLMLKATQSACAQAGAPSFQAECALVNYYPPGGSLGMHQDRTEQDLVSPIVTFSLGNSCIFRVGSNNSDKKLWEDVLDSGDVLVMHGLARLAYHGVIKVLPQTGTLLARGGRLSVTVRQVRPTHSLRQEERPALGPQQHF